MRIEFFLQTRVPIFSRARDFRLGKGVKMYIDEITDALTLFIFEQYQINPSCVFGDIQSLLFKKGEIDRKRLGEITYLEHLQKRKVEINLKMRS